MEAAFGGQPAFGGGAAQQAHRGGDQRQSGSISLNVAWKRRRSAVKLCSAVAAVRQVQAHRGGN